jgi:hypothetical protein
LIIAGQLQLFNLADKTNPDDDAEVEPQASPF